MSEAIHVLDDWYEEEGFFPRELLDQVYAQAMGSARTGRWDHMAFVSTPKAQENRFYELWLHAQDEPQPMDLSNRTVVEIRQIGLGLYELLASEPTETPTPTSRAALPWMDYGSRVRRTVQPITQFLFENFLAFTLTPTPGREPMTRVLIRGNDDRDYQFDILTSELRGMLPRLLREKGATPQERIESLMSDVTAIATVVTPTPTPTPTPPPPSPLTEYKTPMERRRELAVAATERALVELHRQGLVSLETMERTLANQNEEIAREMQVRLRQSLDGQLANLTSARPPAASTQPVPTSMDLFDLWRTWGNSSGATRPSNVAGFTGDVLEVDDVPASPPPAPAPAPAAVVGRSVIRRNRRVVE